MTAKEQDECRNLEATARWLLRESEKLPRLSPEKRDRRAREIARRCELLQKELSEWEAK